MRVIHFPYEIFLIWTSFCPTFIYYFDKTLNSIADSSCIAYRYHFTPLDSIHDSITDTDGDSDLVADVDPDTLIRIVRTEIKNGKAPGIDTVHNIILKKAIGTGFYKVWPEPLPYH